MAKSVQFYKVHDQKNIKGEIWSHLKWTVGFETELFKAMMTEIFGELSNEAHYSYETKKFYVKNTSMAKLDEILKKYEGDAKSFDEMFSDKGKELDEAFK